MTRQKTILITGGAGFMGSNFTRYLYERYPSYRLLVVDALTYAGSLDNLPSDINRGTDPRLQFWYGNVRNGELMDTLVAQSDVIFHFAAETHVTRSIYDNFHFFETDVLGTQVVANAALKYMDRIERVVHISTSEVYGTARTALMDEEHPLNPMSPYASAKAGADRLMYSYWATYAMPVVIIRPFNNYGPNQHLEKVVPRFITSCLLGEPLTVHGDGKSQRDWLFVGDLCAALDRVLHADVKKLAGEAINLGTGRSLDIETIAHMTLERMDRPRSLVQYVGDRPGQVFRHTSSTAKAEALLGWKATTAFEAGLDRTIDWYRQNRDWWEKRICMRTVPIRTRDGTITMH